MIEIYTNFDHLRIENDTLLFVLEYNTIHTTLLSEIFAREEILAVQKNRVIFAFLRN